MCLKLLMLDEDALMFAGRLETGIFLGNQKPLCFAHWIGCCCKQSSLFQGGGNSAGMMPNSEV